MTPSHTTDLGRDDSGAPRDEGHERQEHRHEEHGSVPSATAPALYALCFVLFLGGMWVFGLSIETDSGLLWWVGMALCTVAFLIPMQARRGIGRST